MEKRAEQDTDIDWLEHLFTGCRLRVLSSDKSPNL
jgi:hypothetical protein